MVNRKHSVINSIATYGVARVNGDYWSFATTATTEQQSSMDKKKASDRSIGSQFDGSRSLGADGSLIYTIGTNYIMTDAWDLDGRKTWDLHDVDRSRSSISVSRCHPDDPSVNRPSIDRWAIRSTPGWSR